MIISAKLSDQLIAAFQMCANLVINLNRRLRRSAQNTKG